MQDKIKCRACSNTDFFQAQDKGMAYILECKNTCMYSLTRSQAGGPSPLHTPADYPMAIGKT